jgi:hypothetical protein
MNSSPLTVHVGSTRLLPAKLSPIPNPLVNEEAVGPGLEPVSDQAVGPESMASHDLAASLAGSRHWLRDGPSPSAQPVVASALGDRQQILVAVDDALNTLCRQALGQGIAGYRTATHTRDTVLEAVLQEARSVTADVPDHIVAQLAMLGITCSTSARTEPVHQPASESKDGPELAAAALAASKAGVRQAPLQQVPGAARVPAGQGPEFSRQQMEDIIRGKGPDGISSLNYALEHNRASEVTAFMQGLKGLGLEPERIASIVTARYTNGTPSLILALCDGNTAAVTAFMQGLKGLGLSPQQIADIAMAKTALGTPGLFSALGQGHAQTVTAFMEGLKGLGLSARQITDIALARNLEGDSGLCMAMSKGHAPAITAFMKSLQGLALAPHQIAEITAVRSSTGNSSLVYALAPGHTAAMTAFMEGLKGLGLNAQQITDSVAVKLHKRGLLSAQPPTEKAYRDGLRQLRLHNLLTGEQVSQLLKAAKG